MKPKPPTYFNRKVGDQFTYRGVVHRVVAIHQFKDNRLAGASDTGRPAWVGRFCESGAPPPVDGWVP